MLPSLGLIIGVAFLVPVQASAAVIISEIAWMGTATSANDEWIELQNTGTETVSLDGWTLTDGANLTLTLSGTLPGESYAVLERTDDSSAPGPAFLTYTGALANGGATLTLTRPDGSIEDQVAGGTDWESIGGDNDTKHTPQYASGGWVTNEPTPGAANHTQSAAPPPEETVATHEDDTDASTTTKRSSGSGTTKRGTSGGAAETEVTLSLPEANLDLALTIPTRAHVNQPLIFTVEPDGISDKLLASVRVEWNFGDTHVSTGREVAHTYAYPGEYAVVVHGAFATHEATVMRTITVLPVLFSLYYTEDGALQINNDAPYEIDLSGYTLVAGRRMVLPERTIMLPRATLTISPRTLGYARTRALLYDTEMTLVATSDARPTEPETVAHTAPVPQVAGASTDEVAAAASSFLFGSEVHAAEEVPNETIRASAVDATPEPAVEDEPLIPPAAFPYLGLIGLLALGTGALFLGRRPTP